MRRSPAPLKAPRTLRSGGLGTLCPRNRRGGRQHARCMGGGQVLNLAPAAGRAVPAGGWAAGIRSAWALEESPVLQGGQEEGLE